MTDLTPFFLANQKHRFNTYEIALYIVMLSFGVVEFECSNRELAGRCGISERMLINSRLRLVWAGLVEYVQGGSKNTKSKYVLKSIKIPLESINLSTAHSTVVELGHSEAPQTAPSDLNLSTAHSTVVVFNQKEKSPPITPYIYFKYSYIKYSYLFSIINNKLVFKKNKQKKTNLEIKNQLTNPNTTPTEIATEIHQESIQIQNLNKTTTEQANPVKTPLKSKKEFTAPTLEEITNNAKRHWEQILTKERRLEWAEITQTQSTSTQIQPFYEYWTAAGWRNKRNELQTCFARNWATWINNIFTTKKTNGKSINNNSGRGGSGKDLIRSERRETICKYIANNQREIANALYGEDVVFTVENETTIYA